jgi:hypothetical protein
MKRSLLILFVLILILLSAISVSVYAQPWYVATNGSDSGTGTKNDPFLTIEKAVSKVSAGQTIYIRGGTYNLTATISISKSGTVNSYYSLLAFSGEHPVLNFSGQAFGYRGISLTGSYWHIKGIDITEAGDNGMNISGGSYNIIENCNFYRNRDSGLQLNTGAAYDTIINCDSYFNADPTDYGDADGFAPKMDVGTGNYFYGCRSWRNCDDGWDGYLRGNDDVSTTIENCWAFENGYFEDGTDAGVNANGNGFKMGGSDDKTLRHNFTLKNCLAFKNKAKGFDQNNNMGSMVLYNCTGHNNIVADYRITQTLATGKVLVIKNCADLGGTVQIGTFATQEKNSWSSPFVVTSSDFVSIDATAAYGPRKADGSLPDIEYMHLAPGSDLIDAGVNVGSIFAGVAPDLGCFETGLTDIMEIKQPMTIRCYPNPVKDKGMLLLTTGKEGECEIRLYDITGRYIKSLADQTVEPGEQQISIDLSDIRNGLYIYRVIINSVPVITGKLVKAGSGR